MTDALSFVRICSSMICTQPVAKDYYINISYSCSTMSNHSMVGDMIEGFVLVQEKSNYNKAR
jgi:hypothetical protein